MNKEYYKKDLCDSNGNCKLYNPLQTNGQCVYYNEWCELKDKVADLEAKLARTQNELSAKVEYIHELVEVKDNYKQQLAESEKKYGYMKDLWVDERVKADEFCGLLKKEIEMFLEVEKQLAEKETRIEELESQFAYECECNKQFVDCQNENEKLKQHLAEKDKAIENWQTMYQSVMQSCSNRN